MFSPESPHMPNSVVYLKMNRGKKIIKKYQNIKFKKVIN